MLRSVTSVGRRFRLRPMTSAIPIATGSHHGPRESCCCSLGIDRESECSGHRPCCDGRGQFNETYGTNEPFLYASTVHHSIRQLSGVKGMNLMDHRWMSCRKSPSSILQRNTKKMEKSYMNMALIYSPVFPNSSKNSGAPSNPSNRSKPYPTQFSPS